MSIVVTTAIECDCTGCYARTAGIVAYSGPKRLPARRLARMDGWTRPQIDDGSFVDLCPEHSRGSTP